MPIGSKSNTDVICSFCAKTQQEVKKIIAGPDVYICDECIGLCQDILAESAEEQPHEVTSVPALGALRSAFNMTVVGQQEGKSALLAALRLHTASIVHKDDGIKAPTVLLIGPPGCGKTRLGRALCDKGGLPSQHFSLNRLTATGYIGEDLENILAALVEEAKGNIENAQRGIIVLDGLHHSLRRDPGPHLSRDVAGDGVQRSLVRMLEGMMMRYQGHGPYHPAAQSNAFDTAHLLVALTYQMKDVPIGDQAIRERLLQQGVLPEILSRIDLIVPLSQLSVAEHRTVLTEHLLPDRKRAVAALGGDLRLSSASLDLLAQRASVADDGAWSLSRDLARIATTIFAHPNPARPWHLERDGLRSILGA